MQCTYATHVQAWYLQWSYIDTQWVRPMVLEMFERMRVVESLFGVSFWDNEL